MTAFAVSDEVLGTFMPIAMYWISAGMYMMLGGLERYRLHPKGEEDVKNTVSKGTVIKGVLLQHATQIVVSLLMFKFTCTTRTVQSQPSLLVISVQFMVAMLVMDTWQYFLHRYMHMNKFLYKHIHSWHHTLLVPYPFGASYNHPLEGLLMDVVSGALSFVVSGMTPRTAIFFFSFAAVKGVDHHCALWLPWNPFNVFFDNGSACHDTHHQLYGSKYNFSQPFFIMWDKILGTYMPYSIEKRKEGGLKVRPIKQY